MATVRFSAELRNIICGKASATFDARIQAARKDYPDTWAQTVYDGMLGKYYSQMNALPNSFFRQRSDMTLAGFNRYQDQEVTLTFVTALPFPPYNDTTLMGLGRDRNYGGFILKEDDPRWAAFIVEYDAYCLTIKVLKTQQEEYVKGVRKVVEAFATLGPALKAWPALWEVLPENTKDKHKEIVEKRKVVAPSVEGVDLDSMTAVSALSRIIK